MNATNSSSQVVLAIKDMAGTLFRYSICATTHPHSYTTSENIAWYSEWRPLRSGRSPQGAYSNQQVISTTSRPFDQLTSTPPNSWGILRGRPQKIHSLRSVFDRMARMAPVAISRSLVALFSSSSACLPCSEIYEARERTGSSEASDHALQWTLPESRYATANKRVWQWPDLRYHPCYPCQG